MRINKYLASCGVASRRKCEELILMGKIKVNGEVVKELAYDIDEKHDKVEYNGKILTYEEETVYYMLNKPKGVISAANSKYGETTVVDLIKGERCRIFPVGRLDKDTTGLIILTNDGNLSYKLTHPRFQKNKKYLAKIEGILPDFANILFRQGIDSEGELLKAKELKLIRYDRSDKTSLVEITLTEGRKRQVRRMFDAIKHPVKELQRISEGGIELGDLKIGEYRKLTNKEVKILLSDTKQEVK